MLHMSKCYLRTGAGCSASTRMKTSSRYMKLLAELFHCVQQRQRVVQPGHSVLLFTSGLAQCALVKPLADCVAKAESCQNSNTSNSLSDNDGGYIVAVDPTRAETDDKCDPDHRAKGLLGLNAPVAAVCPHTPEDVALNPSLLATSLALSPPCWDTILPDKYTGENTQLGESIEQRSWLVPVKAPETAMIAKSSNHSSALRQVAPTVTTLESARMAAVDMLVVNLWATAEEASIDPAVTSLSIFEADDETDSPHYGQHDAVRDVWTHLYRRSLVAIKAGMPWLRRDISNSDASLSREVTMNAQGERSVQHKSGSYGGGFGVGGGLLCVLPLPKGLNRKRALRDVSALVPGVEVWYHFKKKNHRIQSDGTSAEENDSRDDETFFEDIFRGNFLGEKNEVYGTGDVEQIPVPDEFLIVGRRTSTHCHKNPVLEYYRYDDAEPRRTQADALSQLGGGAHGAANVGLKVKANKVPGNLRWSNHHGCRRDLRGRESVHGKIRADGVVLTPNLLRFRPPTQGMLAARKVQRQQMKMTKKEFEGLRQDTARRVAPDPHWWEEGTKKRIRHILNRSERPAATIYQMRKEANIRRRQQ